MCSKNTPEGMVTVTKEKNVPVTADPIEADQHRQANRSAIPLSPQAPVAVHAGAQVPQTPLAAAPVQTDRFAHLNQISISRMANVKVPARTLFDTQTVKEFGSAYKEKNISANKRAKKARDKSSPLYAKENNARLFEKSKVGEMDRQIYLLANASAGLNISLREEDAIGLTKLMTGNLQHDQALLRNYAGDNTARETALTQILEDFLRVDLSVYDLSDESVIARNASSFEVLNSRLEAIHQFESKNSAFFETLPARIQDMFKRQKQQALQVVSYYRTTRMIVTDPYYRTHFNSEISRKIDPSDPPEKQRLTRLLWRQAALATYETRDGSWCRLPAGADLPDTEAVSKKARNLLATYSRIITADGEYGKAQAFSDQSDPHYAFYTGLSTTHPGLNDAIINKRLKLAGTDVVMKGDSLGRTTIRTFASLRGLKDMSESQIVTMLENLYAEVPANATPQQIEETKRKNLAGLKEYKRLVMEQISYLDRKYPNLYEGASFDEMSGRVEEIQKDLCSLQIMVNFTDMMKKIPELYDPENAEERRLIDTLLVFNMLAGCERMGPGNFNGTSGIGSLNVNRMGLSVTEMLFTLNDPSGSLFSLRHLDKLENDTSNVKWDTEVVHSHQQMQQQPQALSATVQALKEKKKNSESGSDSSRAKAILKDQNFSVAANPQKTSSLMKEVRACYTELDKRMEEALPADKTAFETVLDQIMRQYDDLISSSLMYENKRNPNTVLGKQRKEMVHTIRLNAEKEKAFFETRAREHFRANKGGTFGDILKSMRTVVLYPAEDMKNKGAGTSTVYRLQNEGKTVFFKEENELYKRDDLAAVMKHNKPADMSSEDEKMYNAIVAALEKRMAKERDMAKNMTVDEIQQHIGNEDNEFHLIPDVSMYNLSVCAGAYIQADKKIDDSLADSIGGILSSIPELWNSYRSPIDKTENEHIHHVVRLLEPSLVTLNLANVMKNRVGVETDQSAALRNVATTRMADLLGIGSIVAKSEVAVLEKNGKLIHGIAMDGAAGMEMNKIFDEAQKANVHVKYSAEALKQIAKMQVLDAICGQIDRKGDNFFGQYTVDTNGDYVITGITAIDNDMAFGDLTIADMSKQIKKENLISLPQEFVDKIMNLEPAVIAHELSDIITADKVDALVVRLNTIKGWLNEKRQDPSFTDVLNDDAVVSRFENAKTAGHLNGLYFR